MTDSFGGIVLSGGGKVLLRKPKNNYDGYSWTFAKTTCNLNEAPEAAAIRAVKEKTGYEARILAKLSGVFKGSTGTTSFYLMDAKHPPSETNWQTERICWETFENAEKLIKESTNLNGRERDLEILRVVAEEKIKIPYVSHPNVQPEDFWKPCLPMPEQNTTIPYQRFFSYEEMKGIMRGYREEHWDTYFTNNSLRLHRSWTGILMYNLPFVFNEDGSAQTSSFMVNRASNEYENTNDKIDIELLTKIINLHLIR
jgi:8-oxo-dGTP pyrophosphatase MutT (NUDIX family)